MPPNHQDDRDRTVRNEERIKGITEDVKSLGKSIDDLRDEVKDTYVTKDTYNAEIEPIKRSVYAFIGAALTAVLAYIIQWFMKGGGSMPPGAH